MFLISLYSQSKKRIYFTPSTIIIKLSHAPPQNINKNVFLLFIISRYINILCTNSMCEYRDIHIHTYVQQELHVFAVRNSFFFRACVFHILF